MRKGISPFVATLLSLVIVTATVVGYIIAIRFTSLPVNEPTFTTVSMKTNDRFEYNLIYVGYIGTSFPSQNTYVFLDTSGPLSANHEIYVHIGEKFRVDNGVMYQLIDFHEGYDKVSTVDIVRVK